VEQGERNGAGKTDQDSATVAAMLMVREYSKASRRSAHAVTPRSELATWGGEARRPLKRHNIGG